MKTNLILALCLTYNKSIRAFGGITRTVSHRLNINDEISNHRELRFVEVAKKSASILALSAAFIFSSPVIAFAATGDGASIAANAKITTGGASTLQSGRTIAITRGVNLDNSDFSNQNLRGVAFQQSIVRDSNFKNSNLVGASFFDATLDGSDFENADMSQCNLEMAQLNRANLKVRTIIPYHISVSKTQLFLTTKFSFQNAVLKEMYVSGATLFQGVKSIENTDWSETYLRKDQQKYLCSHPTAQGTNPVTGVDTRESLMCTD